MTTGGTIKRVVRARERHSSAPRRQRWVDDPRVVRHLPTLLALGVFSACFLRYRQRWFMPGYSSYLLDVHTTVIDGSAIAPNQYRPLVPNVDHLLARALELAPPQAILLVDATLLLVAVLALRSMLARRGAEHLLLAAAAGFAFWFGKLDHFSPETMLLVALVALVVREFDAPATRWGVVAVCGTLMLGARTDYAAALGVTTVAVAATRRSWRVAALGVGLMAGAAAATELWKLLYPQAHYIVDVVQVPFNLSPGSWVFVATYYGTVLLVPALLALRTRILPPLWPALVWFLVEFGAVFIVGRVEESRLFMPFAAVLAAAAALAYRTLLMGGPESADQRPGGERVPLDDSTRLTDLLISGSAGSQGQRAVMGR